MAENEIMTDESLETEDLPISEEVVEEPQDDSQDLSDLFNEPQEESEPQKGSTEQQEPGYVRKRIDSAVAAATKQMQEELAALRAQMEPLREYQLNAEAQELVRSGKVKDLETAKELVRYRQGQPAQQAEAQPRNAQGQFAPKDEGPDAATQARITMLQHEAKQIKASGGPDVIAEFQNNPEVKEKIVSGEWNFHDVADYMKSARKKAPPPMRSPNGASGANKTAIENMSDEQFDRLVKKVQGGARYTQK